MKSVAKATSSERFGGGEILASLFSGILRLLWMSWRRRVEGMERMEDLLAAGRRPLVVFMHGKYPAIFPFFQGKKAVIFVSRSRRGAVLAAICRRFGYRAVLLPEHARGSAFALMRQAVSASPACATAVDGPLGPRHVVKPGIVLLAAEFGLVLLPVSVAARRRLVLKSRWDFLEIPCPFTKVVLRIGDGLEIPRGLKKEEIGPWVSTLKEALEAADRRAEERIARRR